MGRTRCREDTMRRTRWGGHDVGRTRCCEVGMMGGGKGKATIGGGHVVVVGGHNEHRAEHMSGGAVLLAWSKGS